MYFYQKASPGHWVWLYPESVYIKVFVELVSESVITNNNKYWFYGGYLLGYMDILKRMVWVSAGGGSGSEGGLCGKWLGPTYATA